MASNDSDVRDTGNGDERDVEKFTLKDLCRRDHNFETPRRYLADAQLPLVDQNIQIYRIERVKDELDGTPHDPFTVDRVPPISVVTESMDALFKTQNTKGNEGIEFVFQYPSYGCFTVEGVRILRRYDILRTVEREVREEEKWLDLAFKKECRRNKSISYQKHSSTGRTKRVNILFVTKGLL